VYLVHMFFLIETNTFFMQRYVNKTAKNYKFAAMRQSFYVTFFMHLEIRCLWLGTSKRKYIGTY